MSKKTLYPSANFNDNPDGENTDLQAKKPAKKVVDPSLIYPTPSQTKPLSSELNGSKSGQPIGIGLVSFAGVALAVLNIYLLPVSVLSTIPMIYYIVQIPAFIWLYFTSIVARYVVIVFLAINLLFNLYRSIIITENFIIYKIATLPSSEFFILIFIAIISAIITVISIVYLLRPKIRVFFGG